MVDGSLVTDTVIVLIFVVFIRQFIFLKVDIGVVDVARDEKAEENAKGVHTFGCGLLCLVSKKGQARLNSIS